MSRTKVLQVFSLCLIVIGSFALPERAFARGDSQCDNGGPGANNCVGGGNGNGICDVNNCPGGSYACCMNGSSSSGASCACVRAT